MEKEKKKSKIGRLNLKNITSAQNQKRQNTFHELSIQLVSNIHSEPFSKFLFWEANSKIIYTVTARLHKLILAVHNICKKKRNFLNFYPRLKSAETFTVNNASLSPNWTNSLLKSVKETSTFKFQPCCAFQMVHPMKLSGLIA